MASGVARAYTEGQWVAGLGPALWIPQLLFGRVDTLHFVSSLLGLSLCSATELPFLMVSPAPLSGTGFLGPASIPSVS